jgi:hypothetical protein
MPSDRRQLLHALVAYELPIEPVLADLRAFGWDSEEELVSLTRADIIHILERYLAGQLTAEQVTDWADLVEVRDDIGYPASERELLSDVIFRLANPNLREEITTALAKQLRSELSDEPSAV